MRQSTNATRMVAAITTFAVIAVAVGLHATVPASADEPSTAVDRVGGDRDPFKTGSAVVDPKIPLADDSDFEHDHPRRPQYHFTSKRNWINDPNGMVHDGKQYHLFFQHNPLGVQWGNMTWGHAVGPDMMHWQQRPHALRPYSIDDRYGTIFSGTAIIDHPNCLGKQTGDVPTIVAFFTYASDDGFYQAMAYSTDRCQTWTLHNDGKAVIPNQGLDREERDPKVFWHGPTEQWVICLWVRKSPGTLRFFTSKNLIDWEFASDLQRDWAYECPDVFFAPVDGKGAAKTVIYDASGDYEVGQFDGKQFISETPPLRFGEGGNLYAGQLFNNQPQFRVIGMWWLRGGGELADRGEVPFQGQMTFPVEYSLTATENGPRLRAFPIREIRNMVQAEKRFGPLLATENVKAQDFDASNQIDADLTFTPGSSTSLQWNVGGLELEYVTETSMLRMRHQGQWIPLIKSMPPRQGEVQLRVMVDRMSVEAYAFGGMRYTARFALPNLDPGPPSIRTTGGQAEVKELVYRRIGSIWNP